MIDGRIVGSTRDLGSGFCLTDRVVATAAHVVRDHDETTLAFVTGSGNRIAVDRVQRDPTIDVAMLWLSRSLTLVPELADVVSDSRWRVSSRPFASDPLLSGTVTAIDHVITNASGHEVEVLQLEVDQVGVGSFGGYSGSAVTVDGAVIGVLVEQVTERLQRERRKAAANVLYAVPIGRVVRTFRLRVQVPAPRSSSPMLQLLDTAHFDLDALKSVILETKRNTDSRLLGFGIACPETAVMRRLCDWLPSYFGEIECRDWITLKPTVSSVSAAVRNVQRYMTGAGSRMNVVCPVLVHDASESSVAQFWDEIQGLLADTRQWLIVMFSGDPSVVYPAGVTRLASPRFEADDLAAWVREVTRFKRWPSRLAEAWAEILLEEATDGNELSIPLTYDLLRTSIRRVCYEPELLREQLEERVAR
ncbi:S1 family peptidase [Catellatospora chokoriensis]|uniref:Trypsin-like peptidase domain-containing protein n=1 Tax=Catellatospora chokoriensis TaxID=310353 RepID=A0A8J3NTK3_9ACTN|nr:serine protease [Catellatospora chokoriensis]GIF90260.1 hypothetical protein Cch02nite_37040 [Catellatospora chokoriensis]